ncbi:hypothetical protein B1207_08035 [Legionella quinlivanii]|uniref:Glycosyltransferase RgtA/B/C/D-like domain-containing protein n=1 Tax=Legionella quinlivanii TaxID=45073 RepID=A0A364LJS6_9GAMM|nr:hypothetical protein [Legionella quinlivanii]RAP36739.1 hypothetical protein B1207_08035 [Legionella quinlivanii]
MSCSPELTAEPLKAFDKKRLSGAWLHESGITGFRVLYFFIVLLYFLPFSYHPNMRSPNELCRLWQTIAIVDNHKLSVNEVLKTHGMLGDLSFYEGFYYPSKAPFLSFAAVPVYGALKLISSSDDEVALVYWARVFVTLLPTLGLILLLRRFLLHYVSAAIADSVVTTYALGSLAYSYSLLFMSHQLAATFLFFAFYSIWYHLRSGSMKALLLGGLACGAALMTEYTSMLGILGIAGYLMFARLKATNFCWKDELKRFGFMGIGSLPFLVGLMFYHATCFAGPFDSGYQHLIDIASREFHRGGFLGIRLPDLTAFAGSFFSPLCGLFTLSPFLVLALPGILVLRQQVNGTKDQALLWFTVLLLFLYTYFTSSFSYESWQMATGPRHLTPLVVFLMLPVALYLEHLRQSGSQGFAIAIALCALSILNVGMLSFVNYIPLIGDNALFGLVIPLFTSGYLPPNVLHWTGILSNPLSGGLLFCLLVLATYWVIRRSLSGSCVTFKKAMIIICLLSLIYFTGLWLLQFNEQENQKMLYYISTLWAK